ncbi:hypothetical protein PoB_006446200 [Plakobranchus ocellatus]|uniref:Uncharacterized protein n=1 Tax=Plakobranchus ocellatus TaxID=259542 RepID=A0AAV4D181_9GAST|nr:hypothetical protein PoB_006446200 [Plakobranchus ocellatus]
MLLSRMKQLAMRRPGDEEPEIQKMRAVISRRTCEVGIISAAKRTKPNYIVKELDDLCSFDFKQDASHLKNFDLDVDKQKVQWLNIKSMKITKENPNIGHILYDYDAR